MDERSQPQDGRPRITLWAGLACWILALGLSLLQARQEGVRWATPYGLTYLRTLLVPILALLLFHILALIEARRSKTVARRPRFWSQFFFLGLVLALTYWAA
ncbi:MAG TPA: hypothetical protein VMX56_02335, partial [Anaerolineales bacterium]|nr:hypothetical protein [Anaerolineales bacterium]